ncbi:hypothetical protein THAOC_08753 [Thalassiosira oceanica]|uniref:Uncharacterized protein n=1 Tax=Thalassiosira oceanica TaxID=159749 RepID=K0T934_THAOC|nr:hypothetical protein THAOC_08753 [Thalassiosira oceanica]|eukprot:EJK69941.1 hypothetical protein THAOC_08753 [Thalassiosira oceanica]
MPSSNGESSERERRPKAFEVNLSGGFILLSIALAATVAFSVGVVVLNAHINRAYSNGTKMPEDLESEEHFPRDFDRHDEGGLQDEV